MPRPDRPGRTLLAAAIALLMTGAAGQAPPPPSPQTDPRASAANPSPVGDAAASGTARPEAPAAAGALRPRLAPATAAGLAPALASAPLGDGLRGVGGDAAPLCRARCAPAFYSCASGGGDGACHLALASCRRTCEAQAPAAGRLQSPLPAAGLAPAGPLRPLPGGLPALQ